MNTASFVYDIASSYDAFSRLRVSNPTTLFDTKLLYDNQPLLWDDMQIYGNGTTSTHNSNEACVILSVSSNTLGARVRQTYERFTYQPGKSQLVMMTGIIGSSSNGIIRRIGCFDSNDGLFFQSGPDDMYIVKRTSTSGTSVDVKIPQRDWNKEHLNETAMIRLNFDKAQIFYFNYEWLGLGDSCCGVVIGKKLIQLHQFYNANEATTVSFKNPNLPLRYEIINTGTGVAANLKCVCGTVISEGGQQNVGSIISLDRGRTAISISDNNLHPVIAFRIYDFLNAVNIFIESIDIVTTTTNVVFRWGLYLNPTFNTTVTYTSYPNRYIEYNNSFTNSDTISGGRLLYSGYGVGTNSTITASQLGIKLTLGFSITRQSDVMVLAIERLDNQTNTFYASLILREST